MTAQLVKEIQIRLAILTQYWSMTDRHTDRNTIIAHRQQNILLTQYTPAEVFPHLITEKNLSFLFYFHFYINACFTLSTAFKKFSLPGPGSC